MTEPDGIPANGQEVVVSQPKTAPAPAPEPKPMPKFASEPLTKEQEKVTQQRHEIMHVSHADTVLPPES